MARRLIHHYAIKSRLGSPRGFSAPDDFTLVLRAATDFVQLPGATLAYCADMARERVLFTCHLQAHLAPIFAAPFLFVEQLRAAGSVVSVPFERLDEIAAPKAPPAPTLVFSLGRTGSTLLSNILTAAGLPSASEPDMLTQIARLDPEDRLALPPDIERTLGAVCVVSLSRLLGPGVFIKLRSQCNARPLALMRAAPGSRALFNLRRAVPWAMSRHRAFAETPHGVVSTLQQGIDALDTLVASGVALNIVWYETILDHPMEALRLCAPSARIDEARLAEVMARDSQAGTMLSRDDVAARGVDHGFLTGFADEWARRRETVRWSDRTEALVAEMFS